MFELCRVLCVRPVCAWLQLWILACLGFEPGVQVEGFWGFLVSLGGKQDHPSVSCSDNECLAAFCREAEELKLDIHLHPPPGIHQKTF